ncbi:MAG: prepilin peptidase [Archangiaceae bacterium]|nr:prepilin peptidase [Archangiaceae bacterium]
MEPALVAIVGLCLGSFYNVLIVRVPNGQSIVRPGSKCPKCGHALSWYENLPVLSWLALGGKCRSCKTPISPRYMVVELLTGLLFVAFWARFGIGWPLLSAMVMSIFVVPLAFIDAEQWILPFELTLPGIAAGVLVAIPQGFEAVKISALSAAIAFCAFRAVEYFGWLMFKKEAMGAGDKFLAALLCAFIGVHALPALFLLSALHGSVVGLIGLAIAGRAGPQADAPPGGEEEKPEAPPTMTWEFTQPGLSFGRRLLLIPYCIFLQPIPDEPKDVEGNEVEWKPGPTNLPFGPWLVVGALEILLLAPWLAVHVPMIGWIFAL